MIRALKAAGWLYIRSWLLLLWSMGWFTAGAVFAFLAIIAVLTKDGIVTTDQIAASFGIYR